MIRLVSTSVRSHHVNHFNRRLFHVNQHHRRPPIITLPYNNNDKCPHLRNRYFSSVAVEKSNGSGGSKSNTNKSRQSVGVPTREPAPQQQLQERLRSSAPASTTTTSTPTFRNNANSRHAFINNNNNNSRTTTNSNSSWKLPPTKSPLSLQRQQQQQQQQGRATLKPQDPQMAEILSKFFAKRQQQQTQQQQQLTQPLLDGKIRHRNTNTNVKTAPPSPPSSVFTATTSTTRASSSYNQSSKPLLPQQPLLSKPQLSQSSLLPQSQRNQQQQQQEKLQRKSIMSDPTDVSALRIALFGDKQQTQQQEQQQQQQLLQQQQQNVQRTASATADTTNTSSSSSSGAALPRFDAPLSDFIRRIQEEQAKRAQAALQEQQLQQSEEDVLTILPRWRRTEGRLRMDLRNLRRKHQQQQQQQNQNHYPSPLAWGRQPQEQSRKPKFATNLKDQVITLPNYTITLAEASLLLREKTSRLRRLLRSLGILDDRTTNSRTSSSSSSADAAASTTTQGVAAAESILIDPETLELLALELDQKFEKKAATFVASTEEQLLLQRQTAVGGTTSASSSSAQEQQDSLSYYASLPPRPPVVCLLGHVDHGKTTLMDALRRRSFQQVNMNKNASAAASNTNKKKKSKTKGSSSSALAESKNVAGTEAGGITQVISAFQVPLLTTATTSTSEEEDVQQPPAVSSVTFLDTPGHAAFKAMRQSGSDAADIIVLVIAADDGVSAQTIEILNFYKSIVKSGGIISLVVAMNKIDKPGLDLEASRRRIESQLLEQGILVEGMPYSGEEGEYGPPVQLIPVSGLTGQGLDDLVEGLLLQAEMMDLRADDQTLAEGIVMDARVDKGLGNVVDCIIRWGSLSNGDVVVSGTSMGRVRILQDMNSNNIINSSTDKSKSTKGLPSQPVRIVGFDSLPKAGDPLICVESEEAAEELITRRKASSLAASATSGEIDDTQQVTGDVELQSAGKHMMHDRWREALEEKYGLDDSSQDEGSSSAGVKKIRIPVIVKADADGTLAAVRDALLEIGSGGKDKKTNQNKAATSSKYNVVVEPVKIGVGPVLASDVEIAKEGGATIVCFNIKNDQSVIRMAEDEGVTVLSSKVIYSLLDQAREEFAIKYLPAHPVEVVHGRAEVQAVYEIGGLSDKVAGLRVSDGKLYRAKAATPDSSSSSKGGGVQLESRFRVLRNGQVISHSDLRATSLKHFKEDVEEIGRGKECGLSLAGFGDFQAGDIVECYSIEMKRESL